MATYNSAAYTSVIAPAGNNVDRVIPFTGAPTTTIVSGDVLNLCKYPAGYKPVAIFFKTAAAVATSGGTVKIGTTDGTTNDDDSLVASQTATSAITSYHQTAATPTTAVADCTVYATLGGSSGFSSTTMILSGYLIVTPYSV